MTLDDIKGGLRNAVERGESLDKAKQSFINAGYNPLEVEQAARGLNPATKDINSIFTKPLISSVPEKPAGPPKPNQILPEQNFKPLPETAGPPKPENSEKKTDVVRIVLIVVAVIIFLLILNLVKDILGIKLW